MLLKHFLSNRNKFSWFKIAENILADSQSDKLRQIDVKFDHRIKFTR